MKAVITGHSRGLGAAMAAALLSRGVAVLGLSRRGNEALQAQYPSLLTQTSVDLADPGALAEWTATKALSDFLTDADRASLINNAGMVDPIGPAGMLDVQAVTRAVNLNVTAPILLTEAFIAATGPAAGRRIMHVSSGAGRKAYAGWSIYCATKAALDQHASGVAEDALPGLRISSVAPGVIDTDMQATIRATPEDRFTLRDQFVGLKETGALSNPESRGREMIDHLLSDKFGNAVVADIRDIVS